MTEGDLKRQKIFEIYVTNLKFLEDNDIINSSYSKSSSYLCPICLQSFNSINDIKNPLTLEDAPPKSLGGKSDTLTCKNCNNTCGHKIDFHLTQKLKELDSANLIPGTEMKVKIKLGNDSIQGTLIAKKDGVLEIFHTTKNNHSERLTNHMLNIKANSTITAEFLKSRVIPENLEYALLKTAYILVFKKFGYSIILEKCFEKVRQQLLNPEERIYPNGFWFNPPYPKKFCGVYFICNSGIESLSVLFEAKTKYTSRMFGAILPIPVRPIEEVLDNINKRFDSNDGSFTLRLYPSEQNNYVYLMDLDNIKAMKEWIEEKRPK